MLQFEKKTYYEYKEKNPMLFSNTNFHISGKQESLGLIIASMDMS